MSLAGRVQTWPDPLMSASETIFPVLKADIVVRCVKKVTNDPNRSLETRLLTTTNGGAGGGCRCRLGGMSSKLLRLKGEGLSVSSLAHPVSGLSSH